MCESEGNAKILALLDASIPGGQHFCFTQTLQLRKLSPEDQFDSTADSFVRVLHETFGDCTVVTELHESGDVHYHGFIKVDASLMAVQFRWKKMSLKVAGLGFYKIKVTDNYPGWCKYIQKSVPEVFDLLCRAPILRDDFKVFEGFDSELFRPQVTAKRQVTVKDCFIKQRGDPSARRARGGGSPVHAQRECGTSLSRSAPAVGAELETESRNARTRLPEQARLASEAGPPKRKTGRVARIKLFSPSSIVIHGQEDG